MAGNDIRLQNIFINVILVHMVEELHDCRHFNLILLPFSSRNDSLSFRIFLLIHCAMGVSDQVLHLLLPTDLFVSQIFGIQLPEHFFVYQGDTAINGVGLNVLLSFLEVEDLLLELVELGEAKESVNAITVDLRILTEVDGKVSVESLHGRLRVLLEQSAVDDLLKDRHILLEDGAVLQLILLLIIKHIHVLLEEGGARLSEFAAHDQI